MKPVGFNYLGEAIHEAEDGMRLRARQTPEPPGLGNALFARIDPSDEESIWLCAASYFSQPAAMAAGAYFKLCAKHLSASVAREVAPAYSHCLAQAFWTKHASALLGLDGEAGLLALIQRFERLELGKALPPLGAAQAWAHPLTAGALFLWSQEQSIDALIYEGSALHPLAAVAPNAFLDVSTIASVSPTLCWPLRAEAHIGQTLSDCSQAPEGIPRLNLLTALPAPPLLPGQATEAELLAVRIPGFSPPDSLSALARRLQACQSAPQSAERLIYEPLSQVHPSASSLPKALFLSQRSYFRHLRHEHPDWDEHVAGLLSIAPSALGAALSSEQVDACGLAFEAFSHREGFIIADETGLGKGRSLAALARSFMQTGRKVLFLTEKRILFTDFWRDLLAVYGATQSPPPQPFLLHPDGKVYNPDGGLAFRSPGAKAYATSLQEPREELLMLSSYSQFNRDLKEHPRWALATQFAQGALIILDESHVAAGNSQTRKNIQRLIDLGARCIFSSATFAKTELALELYLKAMPLTKSELALLLDVLPPDGSNALARAMAEGLSASGSLIRREHMPEEGMHSQILELDPEQEEFASRSRDKLAQALDGLFELASQFESAKSRAGLAGDPPWMRLGGMLSRLCRQHALLCKIDSAALLCARMRSEGKKPILALQSTFEAFLRALGTPVDQMDLNLFEGEGESEPAETRDEAPAPSNGAWVLRADRQATFQTLFSLALDSIAPPALAHLLQDPGLAKSLERARGLCAQLDPLPASPIDALLQALGALGLRVGEISGRSLRLAQDESGQRVETFTAPERELTIRAFNEGDLDALILTQAGASGISLHASSDFKDQRPRAFIELEISPNAALRQQLLGRVRRKGQMVPPQYFALVSANPFERRLLERASHRLEKLSGLSAASSQANAGELGLGARLISAQGNRIALEWLASRAEICRRLGLDIWRLHQQADQSEGAAEKLLKRLPLLPTALQEECFDFLLAALAADEPRRAREARGFEKARHALLLRRKRIWGPRQSTRRDAFDPVIYAESWLSSGQNQNIGSQKARELLEAGQAAFAQAFDQGLSQALRLAERQRAQLLAHPLSQGAWRNLKQAGEELRPGSRVKLTDPQSAQPVDALLCSITPPPPQWMIYPSQWRLSLLLPGESAPFELSLAALFNDSNAYIDSSAPLPADSLWDRAGQLPMAFHSVSGHCVYTRWWAKRQQFDHAFKAFLDSSGALREQLILPKGWDAEFITSRPFPLLHPLLCIQLLTRDSQLALANSADFDSASLLVRRSEGGWQLSVSANEHDRIIDFALDRKLGPRKYHPSSGRILRALPAKDLRFALFSLQARGEGFFAPPSRINWHQSALELYLSIGINAKSKGMPAGRKGARR